MGNLDPVARSAYRVPRSRVDDFYERGVRTEPTRAGAAQVVSVDGETMTVLIGDEAVSGVVIMGDAPAVGDGVELETRGDLLVGLADDFPYDGIVDAAPNLVASSLPGAPPDEAVNIGGSMKDIASWYFVDPDTANWTREQVVEGIRVLKAAGGLLATNYLQNPNMEGSTDWFGGNAATLTYNTDPLYVASRSRSLKVTWPAAGYETSVALSTSVLPPPDTELTLSLLVFVPSGSPDVRAKIAGSQGVSVGPWVDTKDAFVWVHTSYTTPATTTDPLLPPELNCGVEANEPDGGICYVDTAILREGPVPGAEELMYFDGSTTDTVMETYAWSGTADASYSTRTRNQVDIATLWNYENVEVAPGDTLHVTVTSRWQAQATATLQVVVAWGADGSDALPDATSQVIAAGPTLLVDTTSDEKLTADIVVPASVTIDTGAIAPGRARIGVRISPTANGLTDLLFVDASLSVTRLKWPLGTLWLNPAAGNALPTIGTTVRDDGPTTMPYPGASTWGRSALGNKALVTAPPDCGGIIVATYQVDITPTGGTTQNVVLRSSVQFSGALASASPSQRASFPSGTSTSHHTPTTVVGHAQVAPGATVEVIPSHWYVGDPLTTGLATLREASLTVMFIPSGVQAPGATAPAPVSFWDGDSWRDQALDPAVMNLTKLATVVEGAKTSTTTTLARSTSQVKGSAQPVTLTATTTPGAGVAGGSVEFFIGTSSSGPWTSIGTATLDGAGKATKVWNSGSSSVTNYFRAVYNGSATHATSSGVSSSVRTLQRKTTSGWSDSTWEKSYRGNGNAIDGQVRQGENVTYGNRKSLARFDIAAVVDLMEAQGQVDIVFTDVKLVAKSGWNWGASDNQGTVRVGWHEHTALTAVATWDPVKTHTAQSGHQTSQGAWSVNITSWAAAALMDAHFGGITIGPGNGTSNEYVGDAPSGPMRLEYSTEYWV